MDKGVPWEKGNVVRLGPGTRFYYKLIQTLVLELGFLVTIISYLNYNIFIPKIGCSTMCRNNEKEKEYRLLGNTLIDLHCNAIYPSWQIKLQRQ